MIYCCSQVDAGGVFHLQLLCYDDFGLLVGDACPTNEQTVGIDAKGGAGDQRAIVLTLGDSEERGVVGQDGMDGIY